MKQKIKHYTKEIIFFLLTMTLFSNLLSLYKSQSLNNTPLTLTHVQLITAKPYIISQNKPILIHFWATWCPTCKLEASNIEFLSHHFEVLSIAVNSKDDATVQKYLATKGYTFAVVNDPHNQLASAFNVHAFPSTFIYDKHHNLVFSEVGYTSTLGLWMRMLWAGMK